MGGHTAVPANSTAGAGESQPVGNISASGGDAIWILALFPFLWCAASFGVSFLGGWFFLARRYRFDQEFLGKRWRRRSGGMEFMGRAHYTNCLTLGSDSKGLFLSVLFLFRVGHPPRFVPWSEINATTYRFLFLPFVRLRLQRDPSISLWLTKRLATALAAESHGHLSV
jgi:hypothetical protein